MSLKHTGEITPSSKWQRPLTLSLTGDSLENEVIKKNDIKVSPVIVDNSHMFSTVINILGTSCKYKRISIGTKIIPNTLMVYNEAVKILNNMAMYFFTYPVKDHKQFKLMLFGLPKLSGHAKN